ncbi:MAG: LysM peptidoglycan-binding domain-containing protein, partial [Pseudonocardiaceae bacterium]
MRLIKALGAAVILAALLVAVPIGLLIYPGNPWPAEGISLSAPLTDGAIIGLLAVLIWVLWAQFVLCVITEVIAILTRDRVRIRVPFAMGISRSLARKLVGAVVVAAVSTPLAAGVANAATGQDASHSASTQVTSTQVGEVAPAASLTLVSNQRAQAGQDDIKQAAEQNEAKESSDEQAKKASQSGTSTVTVQRFDSLWSIAERTLGDGERWNEISELNQGRTMADGTKFDPSGPIQPGWKLLVPGQSGDAAEAGAGERVVEPGDTLSAIAAEELGDANAYPKLFDASKGTVQPGGQHLTDPDLIQPGWTVTIPGKAAPDAGGSDKAEQEPEVAPETNPETDEPGEQAPG